VHILEFGDPVDQLVVLKAQLARQAKDLALPAGDVANAEHDDQRHAEDHGLCE